MSGVDFLAGIPRGPMRSSGQSTRALTTVESAKGDVVPPRFPYVVPPRFPRCYFVVLVRDNEWLKPEARRRKFVFWSRAGYCLIISMPSLRAASSICSHELAPVTASAQSSWPPRLQQARDLQSL